MQSSPPARPWDRPSSPAESHYSLDLAALDMDSQSDLDIPNPKPDRIFSEDIDGPSDFTQNMEMWMRGGSVSKGTLKGRIASTRPLLADLEEEADRDAQDNDLPGDTKRTTGPDEQERTGSNYTPEHSPPKASVRGRGPPEETFSSEWHTYDSASTPVPPIHKHLQQPTVEDYDSEFTSARQRSTLKSRGRVIDSPNVRWSETATQNEQSPLGRASNTALSPARSPIIQRTGSKQSDSSDDSCDEERRNLEIEMNQLQTKCQQLEYLNKTLEHALEGERRMRKEEKAFQDARAAEAARRETDLLEMKEAARRHNDDFRREFSELKKTLREREEQAQSDRLGVAGSERDLGTDVQRMMDQSELQKVEHKDDIRALEQEVANAQRARDEALEDARIDRQELEDVTAEKERLRAELQQTHVDEAVIAELEQRLEDAKSEIKQLKAASNAAESSVKALQNQMAKSNQANEDEASRTTSDRTRAVELAAGLQRQLHELRQQLKDERASQDAELERMKSTYAQTAQTSAQELGVVRGELEAKQTELNEAILERDEAQDALESRQSGEESLRDELADVRSVNAELDAQVTEKLQRRDTFWREKLAEADRERQLMAKALLHQWGREEVGIDSPQLYAYRYLNKKSPGKTPNKSPTKTKSVAAQ